MIIIGGKASNGYFNDILEFVPPEDPTNPSTGKWKKVASMKKKRYNHAVTVVKYEAAICN